MTTTRALVILSATAVAAGLLGTHLHASTDPFVPVSHDESAAERIEQMEQVMELVERMKDICFEPSTAGVIAIGALKDDTGLKPREVAELLEDVLEDTETLGLRNALRMSLKDLYAAQGDSKMTIKHLRAMLAENDEALMAEEDDDEEDDEGDDDEEDDEEEDDD